MNFLAFINKVPNFILALALLLFLVLVAIIFQFNGLYGQDAHEYLRLSRALNDYFKEGSVLTHSYFPIFYPLTGLLLSKITWDDIAAMQLVSMLSLVISFFYLKKLIQLIYGEGKFLNAYLACFFFFSPYVFRFGLLSMSDMLCQLFVIASVYHAARYSKLSERKDAMLSSLFAGCAVETRYAVVLILLFPAFLIVRQVIQKRDWRAVIFSLLAISISFAPDWLIRCRFIFFDVSDKNWPIDYGPNAYTWSLLNFFRNSFQNPDGYEHYTFYNIIAATFNIIHPGFLFPGVVMIFFMRKKDFLSLESKLLIALVLVYALFLAGLQYQNNRYLLQSFPFVLVVLYPSFIRITERFLLSSKISIAFFAIVIIIQQGLFWYSFQNIYRLNQTEREIVASLKDYSDRTLYTCSINGALSSYRVDNPVVDLYFVQLDHATENALLLFNYDDFSQHFKDNYPMTNWKFLNEHYSLKIIRSYPQGWALYSIEQQ